MKIDIPEQKNCAWCKFREHKQGECLLAQAMKYPEYYLEYLVQSIECYTDGYGDTTKGPDEESRPFWCPFEIQQFINKITHLYKE